MTGQSLYNAVWRWHFYAGLLVLPFMALLAVTGGLYLFQGELTDLAYRSWEEVPPTAAPLPAEALVARAEAALDGTVLQVTPPAAAGRSYLMTVRTPDGQSRWAFVDPADGRVLGTTRYGGIMQVIRKLHSLQLVGFWASCLIEIAAGWAVILVGTGIYLWWPRGQAGGVVSVRGTPARRVFWRDLHAVTGAFAGVVILFLAVTGMPWSQVWGDKVQQWTTEAGLGEPTPPAETVPSWILTQPVDPGTLAPREHHHHHAAPTAAGLPWAVEKAPVPDSETPAAGPIGLDRALALLRAAGLPEPFTVTLPGGPRGAYVGAYTPPEVEAQRILYLDQYDGRVLGDVGFRDFGPAAKAIEWGVQVHLGAEYGPLNRYLMLAGCIAILLLVVSAPVMWWKRRPRGTLGVPPAADPRQARAVLAIMLPVALFYPLVGASLAAAWLAELGWDAARRRAIGQ